MFNPVDSDKLSMCNAITRETNKIFYKRYT